MAKEYKTIICTCGKELIVVEGNVITEMCPLCPMKLNKYYIGIKHAQYYVEVVARTEAHAKGTFMREYSSRFDYLIEDEEHFKKKGYEKLNTLIRRYSGTELEDKYPPGDPRRKKEPRNKKK